VSAATVEEALALIPERKNKLDAEDANVIKVIHHVEHALNEMRPGVSTTLTYLVDGIERRLEHLQASRRWIIVWSGPDEDIPLLSASREVRTEVFSPTLDGLSPIERLLIEVADNLQLKGAARSPMLEVAKRLTAALIAAGYTAPR